MNVSTVGEPAPLFASTLRIPADLTEEEFELVEVAKELEEFLFGEEGREILDLLKKTGTRIVLSQGSDNMVVFLGGGGLLIQHEIEEVGQKRSLAFCCASHKTDPLDTVRRISTSNHIYFKEIIHYIKEEAAKISGS